jgi:tetratricopeptide (TPR) repeat protein
LPYTLVFERLGRHEKAHELRKQQTTVLQEQLRQVPEDARAWILLAGNHASLGDHEAAMRELQKATSLRPRDPIIVYNAACTYGVMNRKAEALELLKRLGDVGNFSFDWASRDPDLGCLHDDLEFQRLVAEDRAKRQ